MSVLVPNSEPDDESGVTCLCPNETVGPTVQWVENEANDVHVVRIDTADTRGRQLTRHVRGDGRHVFDRTPGYGSP